MMIIPSPDPEMRLVCLYKANMAMPAAKTRPLMVVPNCSAAPVGVADAAAATLLELAVVVVAEEDVK